MTAYQITENDLYGFRRSENTPGRRAMENYRRYQMEVKEKKLTAADKLARIEALRRKSAIRAATEKKNALRTLGDKCAALFGAGNAERVKTRFPAASVLMTLVFACVLAAIVYSSVQLSGANKAYTAARDNLSASNGQITDLNNELNARVDLDEVERIASEQYGMIKKDKADSAFLSISSGDSVEIAEKEGDGEKKLSLISAFAERIRSLWNNSDKAE